MLTEQDIALIVERISVNMSSSSAGKWGDVYSEAKEHAEAIEIHSKLGKFPEQLMRAKAPNETEAELKYRKDSFESITVSFWHRAENSLNRIWAEQNYKIEWPEIDGLKAYFTKDYHIYKSIISYFQSVVTKAKIRDPNSVLAVEFDLPLKRNSNGEIVPDDSVLLEPYASIYDSDDVLMYKEGKLALLCSDEKVVVESGGRKVMEGHVLYLFDDTSIYRIYQVGKKQDRKFEVELYYNHGLGYMPVWKLKGVPEKVCDGNPLYNSYFTGALPHLNKAVKLDSTLDSSISKIAYPIRTYFEQKCPNSNCKDGKIWGSDPSQPATSCPTCSGRGTVGFSPLRDHIVEAPSALSDTDKLPFPGIAYVTPPSEILDFNQKKIEKDIVTAFTFINIDVSNKTSGPDATATEVKIDRDELHTFLLSISNELYHLLSDFVNTAAKIRYMDTMAEYRIEVSPPQNFDLRTAAELTEEISKAKTSGLPAVGFNALNQEWVEQRFNQNGSVVKINKMVAIIDPYSNCSSQEVIQLKTSGIAELWQAILHCEILSYIHDEMSKDAEFLNKSVDEIRTILEQKAKDKAASRQPVTADAILGKIAVG